VQGANFEPPLLHYFALHLNLEVTYISRNTLVWQVRPLTSNAEVELLLESVSLEHSCEVEDWVGLQRGTDTEKKNSVRETNVAQLETAIRRARTPSLHYSPPACSA
jgi:hypothetical protein